MRTSLASGVLACGVAAVLVATPGADASRQPAVRAAAQHATAINVDSKQAVAAAYASQFRPALSAPTGFSGNIASCTGSTSASSLHALQDALNFARRLNRLGPVTFTPALNAKAQRAAIMLAANRTLSHSLPRSARCWSSTGAAAAKRSNLIFRDPRVNPGQIARLNLGDNGSVNTMTPHRRWVLNPPMRTMGSGSTTNYAALYVQGGTSRSQPDPAYVSWPSQGWFPNQLEPGGRWSLSGHSGTDFSRASVRVVRQGNKPATLKVHKYRVVTGYGRPTLVWQLPSRFDHTATYRVVVSGIRKAGSHKAFSHTYLVRLFRA